MSDDRDISALTNADRHLNEVYRGMLASLPGARGEALRAAQRAWVAARDADLTHAAAA